MLSGRLPVNHQIVYKLQDVFNLLPNLHVESLVKAFAVKTNDMMLAVYLASIIRAIVAMHNLLNNKLLNREKEQAAEAKEAKALEEKAAAKDEKAKAVAALETSKPDVVYLPWALEGHPDHHALHHIVIRALDETGFGGLALGYEVWNAMLPDVVLDVTDVMPAKLAAMGRYTSQLAYARFDNCVTGLNMYRSLVHGAGRGHWEAYQVLRGALPSEDR